MFDIEHGVLERKHGKYIIKNHLTLWHIHTDTAKISNTYMNLLSSKLLHFLHEKINIPIGQGTFRISLKHIIGRICNHILDFRHFVLRVNHYTGHCGSSRR